MAFGGNTRDLGSFREENDKITDLHQSHEEVLFTEREDGIAGIKRRRYDLSSDSVRDLAMASGHGRLKEDLESSTIMEYLVNISKRRAFWGLNEDILKIDDSDNQYVITIKEDTAYSCLHSPKTTKETSPIRRIQRSSIRRIQDISIEEVMADKGKKLSMETFAPNDKADYYSGITSITSDKEEETVEIFKIETDVFDYETPLCLAFNEFNYLLKVDLDLLTKDIMRFKTYEDYKEDWIYEWNENVPLVYDKPWLDNGIWKERKPVKHTYKPFNYKTGCSEWSTCSWRKDGYYNGGNLPGAYHIGNSIHYQDLK
ncbi:hypothetical protein Tco_0151777 [Tanacetum coccineum]